MTSKKYLVLLLALAFLSSPLSLFADRATSSNFTIETGVVDTGGSEASSTNFRLRTSVGQPATGISSSTSYVLRGGFLNFPPLSQVTSGPSALPQVGGGRTVSPAPEITPEIVKACDFNGDSKCNIIDLSILLFYYNRAGTEISRYDLNDNKRVDFPDVSVMMFYWTA